MSLVYLLMEICFCVTTVELSLGEKEGLVCFRWAITHFVVSIINIDGVI